MLLMDSDTEKAYLGPSRLGYNRNNIYGFYTTRLAYWEEAREIASSGIILVLVPEGRSPSPR